MKILVVGTGAVGGYFGGRLLQAKRDVTFFVRPQRVAEIAARGLNVRSPNGDFHLKDVPTITADRLHESTFDLAILSSKAPDLENVVAAFAPAVASSTAILPLLNGMRQLDILDARFGKDHVLGGVCMISATRDAQGNIIQFTPMQEILFGELDGSRSPRIQEIESVLANAGFGARASESILQDMWDKWVFIATLAGITCLMRASIGDIEAAGAGSATVTLLDEAAAIAHANGFPTRPGPFKRYRDMLTEAGSVLQASMLRDIENGSATEAEHVVGDLLARGERHGLSSPMLRIAGFHLGSYEARRTRQLNTHEEQNRGAIAS